MGILSDETIISHHPWTKDTAAELEKLKQQRQQEADAMNPYQNSFGNQQYPNNGE